MLNMTKIKLELISDPDMYTFFEIDMRDGVSYISNRYSNANNKYSNQNQNENILCTQVQILV